MTEKEIIFGIVCVISWILSGFAVYCSMKRKSEEEKAREAKKAAEAAKVAETAEAK